MENEETIIEPEKKNKSLIIIIMLAIVILGIVGWFVYDKTFNTTVETNQSESDKPSGEIKSTEEVESNEIEQTEEVNLTEKEISSDKDFNCLLEDLKGEVLNYPTKNDSSVTMTKEQKQTDDVDEMSQSTVTLKYKDYTITYTTDEDAESLNTLEVKDSTNKTIYSTKMMKVVIVGRICENYEYSFGKSLVTAPTISEGKLYFINLSKSCFGYDPGSNWPYLHYTNFNYSYIDLDNNPSKVVNIQSMKYMNEGEWPEDIKCVEK